MIVGVKHYQLVYLSLSLTAHFSGRGRKKRRGAGEDE
jgi:CRISPR/Cas system CMR-associated protein Cmr1 (group 7 of RAMP superfamily)